MSNIKTRDFSISEAARELGVRRTTLYKWIREKEIPAPKVLFVSGIRLRVWTEKQMAKLREYKASSYWGKGVDRRTGKKAKQTKA
jgi:excisionase family DNA binding protein